MISVIIPVYQREKIISNILEDILKQTYQEYEVLIIDDGSTDKTADICKGYEKKDNRIHVYELQHGGVGSARNAGISFAKGEYIAFIDSDDRVEPEYLEMLYRKIRGYDMVISTFDRWFYKKDKISKVVKNIQLDVEIDMAKDFSKYFSPLYVSTLLGTVYCKMFCLDIVKNNNIVFRTDVNIGEDYLFNFDYMKKCKKIRCIPYMGYHYTTKNDYSLTQVLDLKKFEYGKILFEQSVKFAESMEISKEDAKGVYNLYLRTIFKNIELCYHNRCGMTKSEQHKYIRAICTDETTKCALENANPDSIEFYLYKKVLEKNNHFLIRNFAKIRLGYKKLIGR